MRPFFEELKRRTENAPLMGAEIGVSVGDNAIEILNGLNIKTLHLVDHYAAYPGAPKAEDQKHAQEVAFDRLKDHKNARFIFLDSVLASESIADYSLDFVYIDADHSFEKIKADIAAWLPKVKPGGLIGGHDFDSLEDGYGVYRAITEWAVPASVRTSFERSDWWAVVRCDCGFCEGYKKLKENHIGATLPAGPGQFLKDCGEAMNTNSMTSSQTFLLRELLGIWNRL